jgi:hypothetical protein
MNCTFKEVAVIRDCIAHGVWDGHSKAFEDHKEPDLELLVVYVIRETMINLERELSLISMALDDPNKDIK